MTPVFRCSSACWTVVLVSVLLITHSATGQISFSSTNVNLGTAQVGSSVIVPIAVSNNGGSNVTISQAKVSGTGFTFAGPNLPLTIAPRQKASFSVAFAPQTAGSANGSLSVYAATSWGSHYRQRWSKASVYLSATGSGQTATPGFLNAPSSMNLGSVAIGASQSQALTLSNTGGSSLAISSASLTGAGFSMSSLVLPYSLAAGQSVALSITFSPTAAGSANGTLALTSNASDPSIAVTLGGSGASPATTGKLAVTPASMSFGNVDVGSTQAQSGSITASGGSVTLSSSSSSNSQFTLSGLTLPATIAAGQSIPFTLTFAPTAPGAAAATISFFGGTSISAAESVSGNGATIQHIVALSWNPSNSTSVSGYNVYRSTAAAGPYARVNPSLNSALSFSDSTVQSGQTYYYVTTAVDATGAESSYSNQVQAVVPMP